MSRYESDCERIKNCLQKFDNHQIKIIHESDEVKRYRFAQPGTGCYGFNLTCADNLIVMNGDCYSLLIEPGYGRDGLAFLRGSINSYDYFLSKCPLKMEIREYCPDYALGLIRDHYEEYLEKELDKDDLPWGFDHRGIWGEVAYWNFCHDKNIDDPCNPRVYTGQTLLQIAGLKKFVEAYEKLQEDLLNKELTKPLAEPCFR